MRVYVAGPMSHRLHYNHAAFVAVAKRLAEQGHVVETPFEANSRVWQKHYGRPFEPESDTCDYGDPVLREMFAEDVATLLRSDAIALLPDWYESKGAQIELSIARSHGLVVLDAGGEPFEESVLQEAERIVNGDRGASYGHPIDDYACTGRMWGAILDRWLRQQPGFESIPRVPDIDPRIACLMMEPVKISREAHRPKRDNATDGAGYWGCVSKIQERQGVA